MTYEELKPNYLSELIYRYMYLVGMAAALKKDPAHKRITKTAKRLREEEDYDADESMHYAIKKRKFLIERKLDDYDSARYEKDLELTETPSLPYRSSMNTLPYKPMNNKNNVMKTVIKVSDAIEGQRTALILCFIVVRIVSGIKKKVWKCSHILSFHFASSGGSSKLNLRRLASRMLFSLLEIREVSGKPQYIRRYKSYLCLELRSSDQKP